MSRDSDEFKQRLEVAKNDSVAQLLLKCGRLVGDRGLEMMRQKLNRPNLRTVHMSLFPHIDLEGTRLTQIAQRLGISKQAVGQLVEELEVMGSLERVPDPEDGRAKLVRFSEQGRKDMMEGLATLKQLEQQLRQQLGEEPMDQLRTSLQNLLPLLENPAAEDTGA